MLDGNTGRGRMGAAGQVGRDPCLVHLLAAVGVSLVPTELTTL